MASIKKFIENLLQDLDMKKKKTNKQEKLDQLPQKFLEYQQIRDVMRSFVNIRRDVPENYTHEEAKQRLAKWLK